MKLYLICFLVCVSIGLLFMSSCSRKSKVVGPADEFTLYYKVSKGRSPARPAFSVSVTNRKVIYKGIANMDVMGEKTYDLSIVDFNKINTAFSESNFDAFEESYIGRMRDLPIYTLVYKEHSIRYQKREAPEKLLLLTKSIIGIMPGDNSNL